ncbi:MAG: hypothetical protein GC190_01335 [Alphaproteobacteria bacterium]|nr:hypothetical protein [Alphaproteobacteria bacterium]
MAQARKLPALKTVALAYRQVLDHLPQVARVCAGWLGIAVVLFTALAALMARLVSNPATAARFERLPPDLQASAVIGLPILVVAVASPAIVVAWHRLIIREAAPPLFPARVGAAIVYALRTIVIGLIWPSTVSLVGLLPIIYIAKLKVEPMLKFAAETSLVGFAAVLGLLISARFLLVLPAGAIGDWSLTYARSWQLTAGNSWRLGGGFLLAALPLIAVNSATNLIVSAAADSAVTPRATILALAVSTVLALATAIFEASFLSFAYMFFVVEGREAT